MLEGFLGADRFRDGIRLYMRRHREANATADDLWGALGEASGQPILEMANGWIRQTGYPLVDVALSASTDGGARRRARRSGASSPIRRGGDAPTAARRGGWCRWCCGSGTQGHEGAAGAAARRVGARARWTAEGAGRVVHRQRRRARLLPDDYDDATLARLLPAVGELRPAERIALISDQWALVRADQAPIERFLDLVAACAARRTTSCSTRSSAGWR